MQIEFVFQQELKLNIEILDLPILRIWFQHLRSNYNNVDNFTCTRIGLTGSRRLNREEIEYHLGQIHLAASELRELGYTWPSTVPMISNSPTCPIEQQDLNKLHRFFTENWRWCYVRGRRNLNEPNPYDPNFIYPKDLDFEEYYTIIDKINVGVHNLEEFALMEHTKQFLVQNNLVPNSIWIENLNFPIINLSIEEYLHNYKFNLDNDDYPVVLPAHILGKSVIQSFIDNDDPNAEDCLGRNEIGFKLLIDINKKRREVYKSDNFINWVRSHNKEVKSLPLEFYVGKIKDTNINLNDLNNARLVYLNLTDIKFID